MAEALVNHSLLVMDCTGLSRLKGGSHVETMAMDRSESGSWSERLRGGTFKAGGLLARREMWILPRGGLSTMANFVSLSGGHGPGLLAILPASGPGPEQ